jgi:hypothetical protein
MSLSIGERFLVPGIGAVLFAAISWGWMNAVGGDTPRMKAVALCASLFMAGFGLFCVLAGQACHSDRLDTCMDSSCCIGRSVLTLPLWISAESGH